MKSGWMKILSVMTVAVVCALAVSYVIDEPLEYEGQIFILHTNDTHGHNEETVSFSNIAGYRDYLEANGATVFLMDAGDFLQGSSYTILTHGESSAKILGSVGYDVMTIGNHEFDYGRDAMMRNIGEMDTPFVCANLAWEATGELVVEPYTILEKKGVRLGVFGLLTPTAPTAMAPGLFDDFIILDPVTAARSMVETLEDKGCDYIVALGHMGTDHADVITSDYVCSQVQGIDVFIDGHSHSEMRHGERVDGTQLYPSETLIASSGETLNHLGIVTLGDSPDADLIEPSDYSNSKVQGVIEDTLADVMNIMMEPVCKTQIDLNAERIPSRLGESNFADLVCDIVREATGADIMFINGGIFRGSVSAGDVIVNDIYMILPYENIIITKELTGRTIQEAFENGLKALPEAKGYYLQVSGVTVTYDSSKPVGDRVVSIMVGSDALDMDRTYLVASGDFVMDGGDGFDMIAAVTEAHGHGVLNDCIIERMRAMGTITSSDIEMGRLIDISA